MPPSPDIEKVALNGVEQPKRIWLYCYRHAGDVCWSSDPNPEGVPDDELQAVEYVRADTIEALDPSGEVERMKAALSALVAKLDEIDPPLTSVFAFYQAHGMTYSGPTYERELAEARAALSGEP